MEKVFTGRAVKRWQRLCGDTEEFPCLVTLLPQPGLAAIPAWCTRWHCRPCGSMPQTWLPLPVKRGGVLACVCSVSESGGERKRRKAVDLLEEYRVQQQRMLPYKDKIYFFLLCLSWCGVTAYFPLWAQSWARTLGLAWLCCRRVSVSRSDSCFAVPPPYKTFGLFKKFCLFC